MRQEAAECSRTQHEEAAGDIRRQQEAGGGMRRHDKAGMRRKEEAV